MRRLAFAICGCLAAASASALDLALTGFGTIGYAESDADFQYLRYIDKDGTFKVDSLAGIQLEARFNPEWGATVQAVASAPRTHDEGHETKIRWAFVSYRPNNDWFFRAGRLRPTFLLNTQNAEVGVTYDQARLPVEVYSLSPIFDFDGGAVARTWSRGGTDVSVDAYWGRSDLKLRLPFQRDPAQRALQQNERFFPEKVTARGIALSRASGSLLLRGAAHHASLRPGSERPFFQTVTPTAIVAPPPLGGTLLVPSFVRRLEINVLTLGADWRPGDWRVTAEYAQRDVKHSDIAVDSRSGYVTVARTVGNWTPYATHARLLSESGIRKLYQELNATPVPLGAQGPPLFLPANFHQVLADSVFVFDQYSTMLGASYSFSPTSKVKFEWMRTHVGLASALVDGDVHNRSFNVFSMSYSVAF